jgi:hypothetical protein
LPQCQPQVLKGQCQEIFCFRFFHESSSPNPLKQILRSFQIFQKFEFTESSQGAPPVSTTPVTNLPPLSITVAVNFATGNAGVLDTGGKFAAGVNDTGGQLSPVSMTLAVHNIRLLTLKVNLKERHYRVENLVALSL